MNPVHRRRFRRILLMPRLWTRLRRRWARSAKARRRKHKPGGNKANSSELRSEDEDDVKDVPQSKSDAAFLQQCLIKLKSAKQVYDHVKELKTSKEYDDPRVTQHIRCLEGRMEKIVRCKFKKTKRSCVETFTALRAVQDLTRAVAKFEK